MLLRSLEKLKTNDSGIKPGNSYKEKGNQGLSSPGLLTGALRQNLAPLSCCCSRFAEISGFGFTFMSTPDFLFQFRGKTAPLFPFFATDPIISDLLHVQILDEAQSRERMWNTWKEYEIR